MYNNDTIAAISTAFGNAGISIIRISGEKAFDITNKIFVSKKNFNDANSHSIIYGKIVDSQTKNVIDEVLVSKMNKPNTFTREDIVEINCHGGNVVTKKILGIIISKGARIAEPGEFTKRAFLNGRIDLSQAEAVIDIINSKTEESSKAAIEQLEGKLSKKIKEIRNRIIDLLAHIEVTLDYPEHDVEEITANKVYNESKEIIRILERIIRSFDQGRILREGINVAIIGKPNVGKSSLLNELSGKNKAIVTDIPGTTRDIIEEYINIDGIPVKLIDTAGIRETEDVVEMIGVEKAQGVINTSDLIVMMLEAVEGINRDDEKIIEQINKIENKKIIFIINKIDIANKDKIKDIKDRLVNEKIIEISIKTESGIDKLENEIKNLYTKGDINYNSQVIITNVRHKNLLLEALKSLKEACLSHENGISLDCIAMDVKNSAQFLGEITGESVSEDVMHQIFSKFCIGK